jgi:hypothetical protein
LFVVGFSLVAAFGPSPTLAASVCFRPIANVQSFGGIALPSRRNDVSLPTECKDCGGNLSVGFIIDSADGMEVVSTWAEGEPKKK